MTQNTKSHYPDPEEYRRKVCRKVLVRSHGICEMCMRAKADDFHEVRQRSDHIQALRIETGIYSVENIMHLCRKCHQRAGNTVWGQMAMFWILHTRYGYKLPNEFWAKM